jgi:hypothetical protein
MASRRLAQFNYFPTFQVDGSSPWKVFADLSKFADLFKGEIDRRTLP